MDGRHRHQSELCRRGAGDAARRSEAVGIREGPVTTFQAVSGAGYPGVPSLDILGNVILSIGGDEERKLESETQKILGDLDGDRIQPLPFLVSATATGYPRSTATW